jgi:hypothetical protein
MVVALVVVSLVGLLMVVSLLGRTTTERFDEVGSVIGGPEEEAPEEAEPFDDGVSPWQYGPWEEVRIGELAGAPASAMLPSPVLEVPARPMESMDGTLAAWGHMTPDGSLRTDVTLVRVPDGAAAGPVPTLERVVTRLNGGGGTVVSSAVDRGVPTVDYEMVFDNRHYAGRAWGFGDVVLMIDAGVVAGASVDLLAERRDLVDEVISTFEFG